MHVYTPFTNENPFTAITTTITHEKKKTLIFQIVDLTLIFMHKTSQNIFQMTNLIFLEFSFHAAEWEFKWDTITFCERFFFFFSGDDGLSSQWRKIHTKYLTCHKWSFHSHFRNCVRVRAHSIRFFFLLHQILTFNWDAFFCPFSIHSNGLAFCVSVCWLYKRLAVTFQSYRVQRHLNECTRLSVINKLILIQITLSPVIHLCCLHCLTLK